jgi:hypothetical protein
MMIAFMGVAQRLVHRTAASRLANKNSASKQNKKHFAVNQTSLEKVNMLLSIIINQKTPRVASIDSREQNISL